MLTRVSYSVGDGYQKGARVFGSKAAAVLWIVDSAENLRLADISIDERWDPDCVGYKTDDVRRHLAFPHCCIHYGGQQCDCGVD